jgi:hypothetical protein
MRARRAEIVVTLAMVMATAGAATTMKLSGKMLHQDQPREGSKRAVLVELFTSEGCSSCPPADELLRKVDRKYTKDGALIIGVSEHVTYWDHGGWKDPFSADIFTRRQSEYSERFDTNSVYTPQMIVNGKTQFVGSDGRALSQAIEKAQTESGAAVRIVNANVEGGAVRAVVSVTGEIPKRGADVYGVIAEDETTEHVLRGENAGRTLVHASVARVLLNAGKVDAAGEITVRLPLPEGEGGASQSKRHLIVWVQEPNAGRALGVDTKAF